MALEIERFKRTVTSPFTGQEYRIVRVAQRDLFEHLGLLPIILAAPVGEELSKLSGGLKEKLDNPEESKRAEQFALERGVKEPKIWLGGGGCPDGQLDYGAMGDDAYWLARQVIELAFGIGEFKMDKFFRGGEPGDPGPGGPEVRAEAVGPDAGGNPNDEP